MENFRKDLVSRLEQKGIEIHNDKIPLREFTTFFLGGRFIIGCLKDNNDDAGLVIDSLTKGLSDTLLAHKMNQCKIEIEPQYNLKGDEFYIVTMFGRNAPPPVACF